MPLMTVSRKACMRVRVRVDGMEDRLDRHSTSRDRVTPAVSRVTQPNPGSTQAGTAAAKAERLMKLATVSEGCAPTPTQYWARARSRV